MFVQFSQCLNLLVAAFQRAIGRIEIGNSVRGQLPSGSVRKGLRVGRPLKRNSGAVEAEDVVAATSVAGESLGKTVYNAISEPPALAVGRFSDHRSNY